METFAAAEKRAKNKGIGLSALIAQVLRKEMSTGNEGYEQGFRDGLREAVARIEREETP